MTPLRADQGFRAIQYRPDIPNCREVAAFLGDECDCPLTHPHGGERWWIDADHEAECGDWIVLYPSGAVELVTDENYMGPRS